MNLNEMQSVWNSPRNNLPAEEQQKLVAQFTRQMLRRRRFQAIWLTHTFVALTVITVIAAWSIAIGKTHLEQQWALLPLLTAPWLFAFHFLHCVVKCLAHKIIRFAIKSGVLLADQTDDFREFQILHVKWWLRGLVA